MDSYRDNDLVFRLVSDGLRGNGAGTPALHGIGAGCVGGETAHPAYGSSGGDSRALMGNSGKGRGDGLPRQSTGRENVNSKIGSGDFGEPFPRYVADTMAEAMSRGRVYRTRPLLIALTGGKV